MKTPEFLTGRWLCALCVGATLVLAATTSLGDPAIDGENASLAFAAPAELEALANQYATLDQRLHAKVESNLEALGYEATRGDVGGLTLAHDAGLSGSAKPLVAVRGDRRSRVEEAEFEILAADLSWRIVITNLPVTGDAAPAAPLR